MLTEKKQGFEIKMSWHPLAIPSSIFKFWKGNSDASEGENHLNRMSAAIEDQNSEPQDTDAWLADGSWLSGLN